MPSTFVRVIKHCVGSTKDSDIKESVFGQSFPGVNILAENLRVRRSLNAMRGHSENFRSIGPTGQEPRYDLFCDLRYTVVPYDFHCVLMDYFQQFGNIDSLAAVLKCCTGISCKV